MALSLSSALANSASAAGADHLGQGVMRLVRALVATSLWRRKHQGDGLAAYSSGTTDLFTAQSGAGYTSSGNWHTGGANSFSNALAYVVLEELDAEGATTGRQMLIQRGSQTTAGGDILLVWGFAWASGFTGTANATTAPATVGALSKVMGTINGAGQNFFVHLATSPQIGGSGGAINFNFWTPSASSYGDTASFGIEAYDDTANEPAFAVWYDAVTDAYDGDAHPNTIMFPLSSGTTWEGGESATATPVVYSASDANKCLWMVDPADAGAVVNGTINGVRGSEGTARPATSISWRADANGDHAIWPASVSGESGSSAASYKGKLESVGMILGGGDQTSFVWPNTMFTAVEHDTEEPRASMGLYLLPAYVGFARTAGGSSQTNLRTVQGAPAPDTTPPTVTLITPVSLTDIARDTPIKLEFSDDQGLAYYVLMAVYPTLRRADVIVDGSDPEGLDVRYTVTPTTVDGKQRYEVVHEGGWPAAGFLRLIPIDTSGNTSA